MENVFIGHEMRECVLCVVCCVLCVVCCVVLCCSVQRFVHVIFRYDVYFSDTASEMCAEVRIGSVGLTVVNI